MAVTEYTHSVLIRGNYQIVAVTQDEQYDPGGITGYAVLTTAGAKLREDMTLEDARIWIDKLIEDERLRLAEPRARAIRQRR